MERTFALGRARGGGDYRRDGSRVAARLAGRMAGRVTGRVAGRVAHLWPFIRAFAATLDLAGVPGEALPEPGSRPAPGFDPDRAILAHLRALDRYWDARGTAPAYASDPPGTPFGGDLYYDDNAWVGLTLVALERQRPGAAPLDRAAAIWRFARTGWDTDPARPHPGGVFWLQQGRGTGRRNHDRNTVSTAPNAALALHLAELGALPADALRGEPTPEAMCAWVQGALADPVSGLYFDKLRGDDSVDRALWSYNQGNMIALYLLLARRGDGAALARAEAIARRALDHYGADDRYDEQPPAFTAILLRNLLMLHAETADARLRDDIIAALRGYADRAWTHRRDEHDLLRRPGAPASELLDQSALVSVLALCAWDAADYGRLA